MLNTPHTVDCSSCGRNKVQVTRTDVDTPIDNSNSIRDRINTFSLQPKVYDKVEQDYLGRLHEYCSHFSNEIDHRQPCWFCLDHGHIGTTLNRLSDSLLSESQDLHSTMKRFDEFQSNVGENSLSRSNSGGIGPSVIHQDSTDSTMSRMIANKNSTEPGILSQQVENEIRMLQAQIDIELEYSRVLDQEIEKSSQYLEKMQSNSRTSNAIESLRDNVDRLVTQISVLPKTIIDTWIEIFQIEDSTNHDYATICGQPLAFLKSTSSKNVTNFANSIRLLASLIGLIIDFHLEFLENPPADSPLFGTIEPFNLDLGIHSFDINSIPSLYDPSLFSPSTSQKSSFLSSATSSFHQYPSSVLNILQAKNDSTKAFLHLTGHTNVILEKDLVTFLDIGKDKQLAFKSLCYLPFLEDGRPNDEACDALWRLSSLVAIIFRFWDRNRRLEYEYGPKEHFLLRTADPMNWNLQMRNLALNAKSLIPWTLQQFNVHNCQVSSQNSLLLDIIGMKRLNLEPIVAAEQTPLPGSDNLLRSYTSDQSIQWILELDESGLNLLHYSILHKNHNAFWQALKFLLVSKSNLPSLIHSTNSSGFKSNANKSASNSDDSIAKVTFGDIFKVLRQIQVETHPSNIFDTIDLHQLFNPRTISGETPLLLASKCGDLTMLENLVDLGKFLSELYTPAPSVPIFSLSEFDDCRNNAFLTACENGNAELVKVMLHGYLKASDSFPESFILWKNRNNKNGLILASEHGHIEIVKTLMEFEDPSVIDKTLQDEFGCTALLSAAKYGHMEVFEYLMNQGFKLTDVDHKNHNAFLIACREGHLQLVKLLCNKFWISVSSNQTEVNSNGIINASITGKQILSSNANNSLPNNELTSYETTPLVVAAVHSRLNVMEYLINRQKFNLEQVETEFSRTPLLAAIRAGKLDSAAFLISVGASLQAKDSSGGGPLHMATLSGSIALVDYLLPLVGESAKKEKDKHGFTPYDLSQQFFITSIASRVKI